MIPKQVTTSKQYTLNIRDVLRGLLVAVLTPVVTVILTSIDAGQFVLDWQSIGGVALSAFLGYIFKNFLSPGVVVIADEKIAEQVKEGTKIMVAENK